MTNVFIKRAELIEESYQTEDLLDFTSIIDDFKARINKINKNSIVGLRGPYGSGKSTMLYQIYKEQVNENKNLGNTSNQPKEKWFIFDAWQYPERKDLWDGFVLDVARQYDENLFNKIRSKIDGTTAKGIKTLGSAVIDIASLKYPPVSFLKNLIHLFQTSPIKRVYDFQDLLLGLLKRIDTTDKKIFIVIEDIDRSGDMGVFFLETLKNFIKNRAKELKHKIIVIVPIGEEILEKGGDKKVRDSYLKILDLTVQFNLVDTNFSRFIKEIIDVNYISEIIDRLLKAEKTENIIPCDLAPEIIICHLRYLFEYMILKEQHGTMRDIKNILRKSESNFLRLEEEYQQLIDLRILILFTAIEYFYQKEKGDAYTFHSRNNQGGEKYITNNFWGARLFFGIISGTNPASPNTHKDTFLNTHKIYIDNQNSWLPFVAYRESSIDCSINSNYFSATGIKITRY